MLSLSKIKKIYYLIQIQASQDALTWTFTHITALKVSLHLVSMPCKTLGETPHKRFSGV